MRGQTIKVKFAGKELRRSTKHIKIDGKAYSQQKKWDVLFKMYGISEGYKRK